MCNPDDHEANDDGNAYVTQPACRPGPGTRAPPLLRAAGAAGGGSGGGRLIVESFPLTFDGYTYRHGHIAYVEGRPPAPVIQVQHNYAGLKQFDIDQAAFLAKCGYVGLAVDLYRETDIVGAEPGLTYAFADRDPKRNLGGYGTTIKGQVSEAQKARALRHGAGSQGAMYGLLRSPKHYRGLMAAWLAHARTHPAVHPEYAGSIGYCLGCIVGGTRTGLRLARGYGYTFLVINIYTFYGQFIIRHTEDAWFVHLLLIGSSLVGLGVYLERQLRPEPALAVE